jgi:hypothetical protein
MRGDRMIGYDYDLIPGYAGTSCISLQDLIRNPEPATAQIMSNVQNNALNFALGATVFEFGQRFTRRMLRRPINKVNSLVFTGKNAPLRGMGIRI